MEFGCLLMFIPTVISGLVLNLVLPVGGGPGRSWPPGLNIHRGQWMMVYDNFSLAFAILFIIHLILYWMVFRNSEEVFNSVNDR